MPEPFAATLARLRKGAGLSAPALAARAGLSREALRLLERGDRQPTLDTAKRLARALGVPLAAFDDAPAA